MEDEDEVVDEDEVDIEDQENLEVVVEQEEKEKLDQEVEEDEVDSDEVEEREDEEERKEDVEEDEGPLPLRRAKTNNSIERNKNKSDVGKKRDGEGEQCNTEAIPTHLRFSSLGFQPDPIHTRDSTRLQFGNSTQMIVSFQCRMFWIGLGGPGSGGGCGIGVGLEWNGIVR